MRLNLPNTLTLLRIFMVPLLVVVLLAPPWVSAGVVDLVKDLDGLSWLGNLVLWLSTWHEIVAVTIFLTAAATDWLDGKHFVFGRVQGDGQTVVNAIRQGDTLASITISDE